MARSPTNVALLVLVVAIALVELGVREPSRGLQVALPLPDAVAPTVERLRSLPQRHVSDPAAAAVVAGVVFGRADDVAPADEQAFLDAGLWHLLAASGQNVALVAGCCVLLARAFGAGRTTGAVLALAAIPAYVLVVGGGASIVRAGMTGVLLLVAWLAGRLADARHVLVVSAALICLAWPGAHRGLGMQLSYACVLALLSWTTPLMQALTDRGVPRWLAAAVSATTLCSMSTAPILQLRTGSTPLTGIVANVVAVPLAGALLVVGLATSLLVFVLGSAALPAVVARGMYVPTEVLASTLLQVARRAAELPAASSSSWLVGLGVPGAVGASALALRLSRSRRARVRVGIAGAATVVVLVVAGTTRVPLLPGAAAGPAPAGTLRIATLDVGQGDATLLAQDDHAILVDTGPPDGDVVRRVRELGIERVDGIVLTHDSLDHRGGFDAALAALDPRWVAKPRDAPGPWQRIVDSSPRLVDLCSGDGIDVGSARIAVLHPRCDGTIEPRTGDLHNDGAMVLLVEHGDIRALLPADAEAPVLLGLGLPTIDVLRVAHHGSADPRLGDLVSRTRPRIATISVGEGNDYGHPTRQVLDDLTHAGVLVRRTDRDGTIELRSDGSSLSIVE